MYTSMADTGKVRKKGESLGKYCVAGGPGCISCKSNSKTEGVSMHRFPSNQVDRFEMDKFRSASSTSMASI